MNFFKKIRERIGRYFLRKKLDTIYRQKKMININKASSVGLLFVLEDIDTYHYLHEYVTRLQAQKIQVKALGYSKNHLLPKQFLPILAFDFFYDKNLNFYYKPSADCIDNFIKMDFDIIIDLSDHHVLPLKFVSALSNASLKVGKFHELDKVIYDVMIDSGEEHDQKAFLDEIHQYLTILNPKEDV